jgi:antitoxin component of MazEF toxin-antitoxin module
VECTAALRRGKRIETKGLTPLFVPAILKSVFPQKSRPTPGRIRRCGRRKRDARGTQTAQLAATLFRAGNGSFQPAATRFATQHGSFTHSYNGRSEKSAKIQTKWPNFAPILILILISNLHCSPDEVLYNKVKQENRVTVTLRKIGGSMAIVIPKRVVDEMGLVVGDALGLTQQDDSMILRRSRRPRRPLREILAESDPKAYERHRHLLKDGPIGKEIW